MKKTLTINLNGTVFNVDEDAYELLNDYLEKLRVQFAEEEGVQEILDDIEARICELFSERLRYGMQVVRMADVKDIIAVMGQPEQIAQDPDVFSEPTIPGMEPQVEEPTQEASSEYGAGAAPRIKRLMRDVDDRVFAGVCSGLGWYTGVDAWIYRAAFIIFSLLGYGMPLIIYIVMWIILPEAKTVGQKLQMRGEAATVENIRQAINDGEITAGVDGKAQSSTRTALSTGGKVLLVLGGVLLGVFALFLLPVLLLFLVPVIMMGHIGSNMFMPNMNVYWMDVDHMVGNPISFFFCSLLAIGIPLFSLVYALLWRYKRAKALSKPTMWGLGIVWLVSMLVVSWEIWM